ncbi:MAG: isocyanide synthase family protein [Bdellovibrionota bacterium]|nr:isocyanide synthase family protein [Bdellovibrionota bacterium]
MNTKTHPKHLIIHSYTQNILNILIQHRRRPKKHEASSDFSIQYDTIKKFVERNKTIECVLPAFPAKSPNLNKVLGISTDKAEEISLYFLNFLCEKIKTVYPPGMRIILCSDGRVFSDVLNISDQNVSSYQKEIESFIKLKSLENLETYNLDYIYPTQDFDSMRFLLMQNFAESVEKLENRIKTHPSTKELYCAMTRFIFEDSLTPDNKMTKAQLQKKSKHKAKLTIVRSNAWSKLLEQEFPNALRFSIHPHPAGSNKFGIRLVDKESWLTPWHGVALETKDGFKLVKKAYAIEIGAELIFSPNGKPSHFQEKNS